MAKKSKDKLPQSPSSEASSSSGEEEEYNDITYSSDDENIHKKSVKTVPSMNKNNDYREDDDGEDDDGIDYSKLTSIDDLPSDDSISLSDSDGSNDSDSDDESEENMDVNNMSIGEKLARMSQKPLKKKKNIVQEQKQQKEQQQQEEEKETSKKKKKSKHKPIEVSSSHKQYRIERKQNTTVGGNNGISSDIITSNKYKPRDPRMNSLSGHYDVNVFEKRYSFLEQMEEDELDNLKNRIRAKKLLNKKGRDVDVIEEYGINENDLSGTLEDDQKEYANLTNRRSQRQKERVKRTTTSKLKKTIQQNVKSGNQTPYFLKRKDIKQKLLEDKFNTLVDTNNDDGGNGKKGKKRHGKNIDKIMEKKRRTNSHKI